MNQLINSQLHIMGIAVTDVDAADDAQQLITVQLNSTDGRLSLTTHFEGLFFERGNGTLDADMAIRGGMNAIKAALAVVEYLPEADWFGSALGVVQVADDGHTGSGLMYTDVLLIPVTVVLTPDAPTLELGTEADCDEDAICYFPAAPCRTPTLSCWS